MKLTEISYETIDISYRFYLLTPIDVNYNKLWSLINQINLSQNAAARMIGMSSTGFKQMMDRQTMPVSVLEKFAEYFNKPVSYFFDEEDYWKGERNNQMVGETMANYKAGDDSYKDEIIAAQKKTIETLERYIAALERPGQSRRNGTSG